MNDLKILESLYKGRHLNSCELDRAIQMVHNMDLEVKERIKQREMEIRGN